MKRILDQELLTEPGLSEKFLWICGHLGGKFQRNKNQDICYENHMAAISCDGRGSKIICLLPVVSHMTHIHKSPEVTAGWKKKTRTIDCNKTE